MIIDLGNINSPQELHLKFKTALEFPEDYQMNWKDFQAALTSTSSNIPEILTIKNWKVFEQLMPSEAEKLKAAIVAFNRSATEVEIAIEQVY
ncbi:MAG: barstar family protein [Crocinitomicaceae bacterium]